MGIVAIGSCGRCKKYVNEKPGLHYACWSGEISFCHTCLQETGLGDEEALRRGESMSKSIWLDDVARNPDNPMSGFYVGFAKEKWEKARKKPLT